MERILFASLAGAGFLIGICLGYRWAFGSLREKIRRNRVRQEIGDLVTRQAVLVEIREGRVKTAIECSEFAIDCDVSILWNRMSAVEDSLRREILQSLQAVKAYRARWPRGPNGELMASAAVRSESIQSAAQEAQTILDSLPDGELQLKVET